MRVAGLPLDENWPGGGLLEGTAEADPDAEAGAEFGAGYGLAATWSAPDGVFENCDEDGGNDAGFGGSGFLTAEAAAAATVGAVGAAAGAGAAVVVFGGTAAAAAGTAGFLAGGGGGGDGDLSREGTSSSCSLSDMVVSGMKLRGLLLGLFAGVYTQRILEAGPQFCVTVPPYLMWAPGQETRNGRFYTDETYKTKNRQVSNRAQCHEQDGVFT